MIVDVSFEERYWYPDDGVVVWLAGYSIVDPESGSFLARDAPGLVERGLHENAVAVDELGGAQVGWVPREIAEQLAPDLDAGRPWSAVVLREQRSSPRDPRHGLTMLLAPAGAIELRSH